MGIDQVENVGDIVEQAILKRSELAQQPGSTPTGKRASVKSRLAQIDSKESHHDHDHESHAHDHGQKGAEPSKGSKSSASSTEISLRGTSQFNRTKVVVAPRPATSQTPDLNVTARPKYIPQFDTPRFRLTPSHFAYLKIAEGCNHPCSFCIIPRMRGSHRSRTQSDIVAEARALVKEGVKELNLISQDSTYYGLDLRPNHTRAISSPEKFTEATKSLTADATTLSSLLEELNAIPGNFWIRLLYTHPAHWTDQLIQTIARCEKVTRYVDMPLQHIHDDLLQRMRRETSGQYIRELIQRIRAGIPGITLRTTFIVGFPGETQDHFDTLLDFIRDTKFERLGVFAYSQEEGTIAGKMESQLAPKIRQERRQAAMKAQHTVAIQVAESFVGKTLKVLVEGPASDQALDKAQVSSWEHGLIRDTDSSKTQLSRKQKYFVARGEADAPDIDGRIYIQGTVPKSEFAHVRIIGHTDYDLIAEPVTKPRK
jgi:ribosomal protein S12 methylthiotransferase